MREIFKAFLMNEDPTREERRQLSQAFSVSLAVLGKIFWDY
jgi:hypothetical protein